MRYILVKNTTTPQLTNEPWKLVLLGKPIKTGTKNMTWCSTYQYKILHSTPELIGPGGFITEVYLDRDDEIFVTKHYKTYDEMLEDNIEWFL